MVEYTPGEWVAVVGEDRWILVGAALGERVIDRCWALVRDGGVTLDDLHDVIRRDGLTRYAAVARDPAGVRVIARGGPIIDIATESGDVVVHAGDPMMCLDRVVPGPVSAVTVHGSGSATGPRLPLDLGVVLAGSLWIGEPVAADAPTEPPSADQVGTGVEPMVAELMVALPVAALPVAEPVEPLVAEPVSRRFDHMFGLTVLPAPAPVEHESVAVAPAADPPPPPPPSQPAPPPMARPQQHPVPVTPRAHASVTAPTVGLIGPVPWLPLPSASGMPANGAPANSSYGGGPGGLGEPATMLNGAATVSTQDRTNVRPRPDSGTPMVPAVSCQQGHPNPSAALVCRQCGEAVPTGQQPHDVPRPVLGVLRPLAGGEPVVLDRATVLGRDPRVQVGPQRNVIRVPSPHGEVSGTHLAVALDGWSVIVEDLGSTNGTTVATGGVTRELTQGEPVVIEPGAVVTLGGEVALRFEAGPR